MKVIITQDGGTVVDVIAVPLDLDSQDVHFAAYVRDAIERVYNTESANEYTLAVKRADGWHLVGTYATRAEAQLATMNLGNVDYKIEGAL